MNIIKGDLIKLGKSGIFDVIVHGCNCFNTMGAGIALQIKRNFPEAYQADCRTERGDKKKLGLFSAAKTKTGLIVVNAYTQYNYGRNRRFTDYDAIKKIFRAVAKKWPEKHIGYPYIGAGLAGGDWAVIKPIIDRELQGMEHTLVQFCR